MTQAKVNSQTRNLCMTSVTYDRLSSLLEFNRDHPMAGLLEKKLANARKCAGNKMSPDTVTVNRRVRYHPDAGKDVESRILVYPKDYVPTGIYLSVMSPLGLAILGLREGEEASYEQWDGTVCVLTVGEVEGQPAWEPSQAA